MIVAAILAAGASRRLGSPKQLAIVDGEPLLRRTVRIALAARVDRVAVVLGAHRDLIEPTIDDLTVEILANEQWEEGMASSARAAAAWARRTAATRLVLLVGDQQRLTTEHLDALVAHGGLVGSAYDGVVGVPAVFPERNFPEIEQLSGDRGARELLRGAPAIPWAAGAIDLDIR